MTMTGIKKIISILISIAILMMCGAAMATASDVSYTGVGTGKNGDVKVSVTFDDGRITDVDVIEHNETAGICEPAIERIPAAIVENQSIAVDAVAGATLTSQAILNAVADCIVQAGGDLEDYQVQPASPEKSTEVKDLTCDVVIVGAGGSGMAAAMAANEAGAKVILVEKSASIGGSSVMSGGMGAVGSSLQAESGTADFTAADWLSDWLDQQNYMVSAPMIFKYISESGKTVDWLIENGVEMEFVGHRLGDLIDDPIATYHTWSGDGLAANLKKNLDRILADGGEIFYETTGKSVIMENGEAKGIVAEQADGTTLNIHARAVIICTGGYGADAAMMEELLGFKTNGINSGTQTGDGIRMGVEAGAATEGMENVEFHGVAIPDELKPADLVFGETDLVSLLIEEPSAVWVNSDGDRFTNEDITYDTAYTGNIASRQGDQYYSIVNQYILDVWENDGQASIGRVTGNNGFYPPAVDEPWVGLSEQLEKYMASGAVVKADTLEELAEKLGISVDHLTAAFAMYNDSCKKGVDEYLGKPAEFLIAMEDGPYYAVIGRASELCTLGGLKITTDMEVVSTEGSVIPGLYSAGVDCSGSIFHGVYVSYEGVTMGWAMTSGRLAGENAAAFALTDSTDAASGATIPAEESDASSSSLTPAA